MNNIQGANPGPVDCSVATDTTVCYIPSWSALPGYGGGGLWSNPRSSSKNSPSSSRPNSPSRSLPSCSCSYYKSDAHRTTLLIYHFVKILMYLVNEREIFYLTTHSTHFIYGYMATDMWLRTILIVRKEIRCRHIGYSYRLTARVLLYAPSHSQDKTYHGLCYTSRGALAGTRNSSMGPPHEGSIR